MLYYRKSPRPRVSFPRSGCSPTTKHSNAPSPKERICSRSESAMMLARSQSSHSTLIFLMPPTIIIGKLGQVTLAWTVDVKQPILHGHKQICWWQVGRRWMSWWITNETLNPWMSLYLLNLEKVWKAIFFCLLLISITANPINGTVCTNQGSLVASSYNRWTVIRCQVIQSSLPSHHPCLHVPCPLLCLLLSPSPSPLYVIMLSIQGVSGSSQLHAYIAASSAYFYVLRRANWYVLN